MHGNFSTLYPVHVVIFEGLLIFVDFTVSLSEHKILILKKNQWLNQRNHVLNLIIGKGKLHKSFKT